MLGALLELLRDLPHPSIAYGRRPCAYCGHRGDRAIHDPAVGARLGIEWERRHRAEALERTGPRWPGLLEGAVRCWSCDTVTDDATGVTTRRRPAAGDVSVCAYCGALGVFTGAGYATRQPSADERAALLADPTVERTVAAVLEHKLPR